MITAFVLSSLDIYRRNQRLGHVNNPSLPFALACLKRLDGEHLSEMMVANARGWLDISRLGDSLSLCFCDYSLASCRSEIVSREIAAEWIEYFMDDEVVLADAICLA